MLQGKFSSIAYLPLEKIIERITGRETYDMKDLQSITVYEFLDKEGLKKEELK